MTIRIQENLRKTGYAPGENRGNLPVICPAYCEKCGRVFIGDNCTQKICKMCENETNRKETR